MPFPALSDHKKAITDSEAGHRVRIQHLAAGSPQVDPAGHTQKSGNPIAAEVIYCWAGAVF